MVRIKNLIYALTCLAFSCIIGAGLYEHLAIWPRVFAAPPASLTMFQGEYALYAEAFWSKIHPIILLLLITTLVVFWKSKRRKNIIMVLVGYFIIVVTTFTYFVPELMDITNTEFSNTIDNSLIARGQLWENLSLLRLTVIVVLAIFLLLGLTKNEHDSK